MKLLKIWIRKLFHWLGYRIITAPPNKGAHYEPVFPAATYNPWNKNAGFLKAFETIRAFTLVDRYRCYELWQLVEQSAKLESGSLLEVGVWRGGTGALIATQARNCGIPDRVFLCDTFEGVVKASAMDAGYSGGEHKNTSLPLVQELVHDRMGLDNVEILQGMFPEDTGSQVEQLQFRFCHIDVDVYQSAKDAVEWVWDRLVPGGIVVFDDYGFAACDGIADYVDQQMGQSDRIVLHNLNGHAIFVKR